MVMASSTSLNRDALELTFHLELGKTLRDRVHTFRGPPSGFDLRQRNQVTFPIIC